MADETENETPDADDVQAPADQPEQAVEPQAPEAQADEAPDAEAPAAEGAAEAVEAGADGAEEASSPEEASEAPQRAAAPAPEPGEKLSPKEIRRRRRSRHAGDARPPRTAQERHADRLARRAGKAVARRTRRAQERTKAAERRAATPAREPLAPLHPSGEGTRRERQGVVVSDKAEKTITVRIDVARRHRRYEKIVRSSSTLHAHDENNEAHVGDVVRVIESRPLSKTKRWRLVDVLERAR